MGLSRIRTEIHSRVSRVWQGMKVALIGCQVGTLKGRVPDSLPVRFALWRSKKLKRVAHHMSITAATAATLKIGS